jgi:hypothetical protein
MASMPTPFSPNPHRGLSPTPAGQPERRLRRLARTTIAILALVAGCGFQPTVLAAEGAAKKGTIHLDKKTSVHREKWFKPGEQPADLAYKLKNEAGLCDYRFGLQIEIGYELPRLALKNITATVTSIRMTLTLESTIWLAENSTPKIIDHEAAHRAIAETYYFSADKVAAALAEKAIGRKLTVPNKDRANGIRAAIEQLDQQMLAEFQRTVSDRCEFAEQRFDEITDHSRAKVSEQDAIDRAIAEEKNRKI